MEKRELQRKTQESHLKANSLESIVAIFKLLTEITFFLLISGRTQCSQMLPKKVTKKYPTQQIKMNTLLMIKGD